MALSLKNNAVSKLAASLTTSATSLSVTTGEGSKFPSLSAGDWFPVTLIKADGTLEVMRCTGRSGDVLTVTRAQEGTAATAFAPGDRVEIRLTAAALNDFLKISSIAGTVSQVSGVPTGAVIETGTNANGTYIKFADGTMICRHTSAQLTTSIAVASPMYMSPLITLTFPAAFVAVPSFAVGTVNSGGYFSLAAGDGVTNTTNWSGRVISIISTATASLSYIAIGRWF